MTQQNNAYLTPLEIELVAAIRMSIRKHGRVEIGRVKVYWVGDVLRIDVRVPKQPEVSEAEPLTE